MGHSEFVVFKGKMEDFANIQEQIVAFVDTNKVAARSIGIEFIEHTQEILVSLGYASEGEYLPISLAMVNLGVVDLNDTATMGRMMSDAAKQQKNVICHEHCVTDTNEFRMVFMSTK